MNIFHLPRYLPFLVNRPSSASEYLSFNLIPFSFSSKDFLSTFFNNASGKATRSLGFLLPDVCILVSIMKDLFTWIQNSGLTNCFLCTLKILFHSLQHSRVSNKKGC